MLLLLLFFFVLGIEKEEKYVKLSLVPKDDQQLVNNETMSNVSIDDEQINRDDLKYSIKIFLRSLEPELLRHTIDQSLWAMDRYEKQNCFIDTVPQHLLHIKMQCTLLNMLFINKYN